MSIIAVISKSSPKIQTGQSVKFKTDFEGDIDEIIWFIDNVRVSELWEFRHIFNDAGSYAIKCKINEKYFLKKTVNVYGPAYVLPENDSNYIYLRYVNQSNTVGPTDIITFQKNVAVDFGANSVAWRIISLSQNESENTTYDRRLQLGYDDPEDITTVNASAGNLYGLDNGIYYAGSASSGSEIQTINTNDYSVDVKIYRSGKLLYVQSAEDNETSEFRFNPTIWVGVVSEITEGSVIDEVVMAEINTEISFLGIKSADIVMTGGGVGPSATPYSFSLQNIVFA